MKSLENKTAVITGAASGLGLAFAHRFARAGMDIVMADVEEHALAEAKGQVEQYGRRVSAEVVDVSDAEQVQRLADSTIAEHGRVNLVCNNAGVGGSSLTAQPGAIALKDWKWVLDVNLWGVIHGHAAFLPHLLEHGDGHIVNTASMAGHFPGHSAYGASKWAVVGLSEGLYHQLNDAGSTVGISCLCPGWVSTRIGESARNRPEWAAPAALEEPSPEAEARYQYVRDQVASGLSPELVADLVHDAVVASSFWVFTDMSMVDRLKDRYDAVLNNRNPPRIIV